MNKPAQPIKVIFFDIDDTLYFKKERYIPDTIPDVIKKLKANNIIPAIATGRTFGAFPKLIHQLISETGIDLFVTINGQYNIYKNNVISHYPLPTERIERVICKLKQLNIEYAFVTANEIAASSMSSELDEALKPIKEDYIVDPHHYLHHTVYQLLVFYSEDRTQEIYDSNLLEDDLKEVRWHKYSVDILKRDCSKARGIQNTLDHLNIPIDNAMAFGDGLNDMEMLSSIGFGVAMGNAVSELKQIADYVTLPINEDGIFIALKHLNIID